MSINQAAVVAVGVVEDAGSGTAATTSDERTTIGAGASPIS